jgi:beta-galactosidase
MYRNLRLVKKSAVHIPYNGVWLRQLEVGNDFAKFLLTVEYEGPESVSFRADIRFRGETVARVEHGTYFGELSDIFVIPNVRLWDLDTPDLYEAHVFLLDESGNEVDNVVIPFGVRTIRFTPEEGLILNGRRQKINGVCKHHDMGSLGAAVSEAALRRQLRILREMGVNAIRTSHNPPSPELLNLCDEMGFLVMDEFFDEWYIPKIANGYAQYFREHAAKADAASMYEVIS